MIAVACGKLSESALDDEQICHYLHWIAYYLFDLTKSRKNKQQRNCFSNYTDPVSYYSWNREKA